MQSKDIEKIVVNACINDFRNKDLMKQAKKDLVLITGQKPVIIQAKKSIASFKIREGQDIAYKTTLRGQKMRDFFIRLIGVVIPRIKDFRGIEISSFDGQGNLTIGIREHSVFPEIDPEESPLTFPLEITIVSNVNNDKQGKELLKKLGFPIKDA